MTSQAIRNPLSKSLGLHFVLVLAVFYFVSKAPKINSLMDTVTIDLVEESQKNEIPEIHKKNTVVERMIVQKSEGRESTQAKDKAYLSDKTRVVDEQTSAKVPGQVDASGRLGSTTESTRPVPADRAANKTAPRVKAPKEVKLSDLGVAVKFEPTKAPTYEEQRQWANSQTGEAIRGGQYIQGMKEGETSALNTKEFVFFSYFDRVRKQLDQAWQPMLREQVGRIYKNGRRLASNSDYTTKTMVTLTQRGEIVRVQILEESGTFDLDQVAIDALNKAGPYPNPPKGLVDAGGNVQIRWDFVLRT